MDSEVVYKILSEELEKEFHSLERQRNLSPEELKERSAKTAALNSFVRRVFNRLQMAEYIST